MTSGLRTSNGDKGPLQRGPCYQTRDRQYRSHAYCRARSAMSYIGLNTIRDFALLIDVSVVTHPACPQTSVDAHHQLVSVEAHTARSRH